MTTRYDTPEMAALWNEEAKFRSWLLVEKIRDGHPTTLGAASGAVAGLVAITPACGFVSPVGAIALGLIAGSVCALATALKFKFGFDDALDVVGVHLVGGVLGALLIGVFGTSAVDVKGSMNGTGADGLLYGGGFTLLGIQAMTVAATVAYSFVGTLIIGFVVKLIFGGLKVSEDVEVEGLDISIHAETAYETLAGSGFKSSSVKSSAEVSA